MIAELTECRICKSYDLKIITDLGSIYPSSFIKTDENPADDMKAPLVLCRCGNCGLVQLKHTVDLDSMYRQYWYSSSLNKSMVTSLEEIVREIEGMVDLQDFDTLVYIGANDCTMLGQYKNKNLTKVGYDPALNLNKPEGIYFINDYFSSDVYMFNKAKVITAIAMFYDLPNPVEFTKQVASILDDDGIFVIQYTDLCSMLRVNAFDNLCHEHLEYYSFEVVKNLLESNGLQVIDVSHNDVNGASIRVTASFPGKYRVSDSVSKELEVEKEFLTDEAFNKFSESIKSTKVKLSGFLKWAKSRNKRVYIMGASTKGNSLLQVCGVTNEDCEFASEVNKDKFGLKTIGSNIEIISEEESLIKHPDYFIVLPWHFKSSLITKSGVQDYLNSNGRLIFPLPEFTVVTTTGEFKL